MKYLSVLLTTLAINMLCGQSQECEIQGRWSLDRSSVETLQTTRVDGEYVRESLTLDEVRELSSDFILPDSVVFYDKLFKIYFSRAGKEHVEEGSYKLARRKFQWVTSKTDNKSNSSTKSKIYKRVEDEMGCYLKKNGLTFFRNLSGVEQIDGKPKRSIKVTYRVIPQT